MNVFDLCSPESVQALRAMSIVLLWILSMYLPTCGWRWLLPVVDVTSISTHLGILVIWYSVQSNGNPIKLECVNAEKKESNWLVKVCKNLENTYMYNNKYQESYEFLKVEMTKIYVNGQVYSQQQII